MEISPAHLIQLDRELVRANPPSSQRNCSSLSFRSCTAGRNTRKSASTNDSSDGDHRADRLLTFVFISRKPGHLTELFLPQITEQAQRSGAASDVVVVGVGGCLQVF